MSWLFALFLLFSKYCTSDQFTEKRSFSIEKNELFELSIVHLNDFHARFVPTSPWSSKCHKGQEHECIGGLARVSTVSRQLLKERPNAIFLNAGDNYQGTMWYYIHKWNITAHFMNLFPFNAMTLGNHEYGDGIEGLVPFLQRVRAPIVVSNIDVSEEPRMKGLYNKSTIITRGNRKIGIIGVVTKTTQTSSLPGRVKLLDEVESINAEAKKLKDKGVDIIIVLSHVGINVDRTIANHCPEVDIIVGGHSHTLLYSGIPPSGDDPVDEYPVVVKQNVTRRTVLIVQASAFTRSDFWTINFCHIYQICEAYSHAIFLKPNKIDRYLGNLTVRFDRKGEVIDWEGNPVYLDTSIEEDPQIIRELEPWAESVNSVAEKVVGETRSFLNNTCNFGECNMADLITDSMVHAYRKKAKSLKQWTYAAIACVLSAGIRTNIPAGEITFGDLATVLPFRQTCDVVELKGLDLLRALEESVSRVVKIDRFEEPRFLQWSGIKVVYNMSMPAWSRVQSLRVRCQDCKVPKYEPLIRDKWYRVVVQSYIADGYYDIRVIAENHRNRQLGPLDVDAFQEYVETISPFTYESDRRVLFVK